MKLKQYFPLIIIFLIFIFLTSYLSVGKIGSIFRKPPCPNCNIILISIDTLGSNHLPCYGYERKTSPNLCKFAEENIHFTQSFSNAGWTLPSHFSIFTSLYPKHHGVQTLSDTLPLEIKTLPQIFNENDYETVYVGPTKDNSLPLDGGIGRGFGSIIRYLNINDWEKGYDVFLKNLSQGKKTFMFLHTYSVHDPYLIEFPEKVGGKRLFTDKNYPEIPVTDSQMHRFTEKFKEFLLETWGSELVGERTKQSSYEEREEISRKMRDSENLEEAAALFETLPWLDKKDYWAEYYSSLFFENDDTMTYARDLYDEGIYYFDEKLIKLFKLLSNKMVADKTIVVITSDHGEEFMEHGWFTHSVDQLYNTTTSTPLIMYIPGLGGKKIDDLTQSIDIMPTLLGLVGIKNPDSMDGLDLNNIILGKESHGKDRFLISEGSNDSIRKGDWKLYVDYFGFKTSNSYELYNLSKDPLEKNNVARSNQEIVDDLMLNLNRIIYKK
jgi:arylsulfatase A-like enzyme